MHAESLAAALAAWRATLGSPHVVDDEEALRRASTDIGAFPGGMSALIYPAGTAEVQDAVRIANRHRVPLYAVSCGRNWGMGSRLPVRPGCVVMELSRMNRIHEINTRYGYAVVEPGVTQRQLHDTLQAQCPHLFFNVTGSSSQTSLVGNLLERGVGYFASRAEEGSGFEVVLGTGEVLHTGYGHYPDCTTTHLYRHGLGPSLDGLFVQGNFGIVTRLGIPLTVRPPANAALVCNAADEAGLAALVDGLATLIRGGVIHAVAHIGNRRRAESSLGPLAVQYLREQGVPEAELTASVREFLRKETYDGYTAVCGLGGTPAQLRLACREVRRAMRGITRVRFVDERRLQWMRRITTWGSLCEPLRRKRALLPAVLEIYRLSQGFPTDGTIRGVYWPSGAEYDPAQPDPNLVKSIGWAYCLPMIPFSGEAARLAVERTESICRAHGLDAYITLNPISPRIMEGVVNIAFRRDDPTQVDTARRTLEALQDAYLEQGWYPYRLSVAEMERFVTEADPYWGTIRDLKQVFDPNHILSPGRYNLV
jgi:4-cresol dehydrogenase (hydroxylating)